MGNKETKLTVWESACIITGYGIGGGVMAMPYLASINGVLGAFIILTLAFISSIVLHLMIAELSIKSGQDGQIISVFSKYLFTGRKKQVMTLAFFIIMVLVLFTNLAAYIEGAQEILTSLLGVSPMIARLIFYFLAASVVLFGLKAVGISEKIAVAVIYTLILVLTGASFMHISNPLPLALGSINAGLAYFGMAMFAFSAFFSVPQAVKGLDGDSGKVTKAVVLGMLNNYILIILITAASLLSSAEVTEVAMVGWSRGIGKWAELVGSLFTLLAMITTYWSISLALSDIVEEQTRMNKRLCWIIATLPSLILALLPMGGFMEFMRLAGGLIAIIVAVMVIPAFRKCRKEDGDSIFGKKGGTALQIAIAIAYVFMAIGNVVTI